MAFGEFPAGFFVFDAGLTTKTIVHEEEKKNAARSRSRAKLFTLYTSLGGATIKGKSWTDTFSIFQRGRTAQMQFKVLPLDEESMRIVVMENLSEFLVNRPSGDRKLIVESVKMPSVPRWGMEEQWGVSPVWMQFGDNCWIPEQLTVPVQCTGC